MHTGQAAELAPILLAVGCDRRAPRIERDLPWDDALVHDAERERRLRAHAWLDLKLSLATWGLADATAAANRRVSSCSPRS